jgi:flavin reductase (DIM6/NTAB) family NADH-FMN oxidoreductase RutF
MAVIIPGEIPTKDLHQYLLAIVAPRPIAFVSTLDAQGITNLAPFSFFNCFSSNPPIVVFSANRRVANNTTKDTLANIEASRQCVINAVSHEIVRQVAICSCDFAREVDEFEMAGLTPVQSTHVAPPRVAESPAALECEVIQILPLGDQGGAGNLIICQVLCIHVHDDIVNERHRIDPDKIDLMGRMGRMYYTRASGESIHEIIQAYSPIPVGYAALPDFIRHSEHLSANDVGTLAGLLALPTDAEVDEFSHTDEIAALIAKEAKVTELINYAKQALKENRKEDGAKAVYLAHRFINQ